MANGLDNQLILPKYFSKVIYCVVSYNAWMDEPVTVGYQKKGPLVLGTLKNELQAEMKSIADIFNQGVETVIVPHIQDAVHCKIVVNLVNPVTTLMGQTLRPISDMELYQKIMTNVVYEGMKIIQAAGFRECKLGGMPTWRTIWMGVNMPRFISGTIFKKNVKKMNLSSMAQDVLLKKSKENELDSITGYIVELADKHHVPAPFNKAIYAIAKQEFAKPDFKPLDVKDVWEKIQANI
jgi:2-dehydropantoate 2-reductase